MVSITQPFIRFIKHSMKTYKHFAELDSEALSPFARSLENTSTDVVDHKVEDSHERLSKAWDRFAEHSNQARQRVVVGAKAVDGFVRESPYISLGIALGIGSLIGFLIQRRCRD